MSGRDFLLAKLARMPSLDGGLDGWMLLTKTRFDYDQDEGGGCQTRRDKKLFGIRRRKR